MGFLKNIFGAPDIERLQAENNISGLIAATSYSKNDNIRRQAIIALGDYNEMDAIERLILIMADDKDEEVRTLAGQSLIKIGISVVKPLVKKASLPSKEVIKVLFNIGPAAVQPMTETLIESDWETRKAIYYAFEKIRWRPSSEKGLLIYSVFREDWDYCKKIGKPAVETLTSAVISQSLSNEIRRGAGLAVNTISDSAAINPILQAIPIEPLVNPSLDYLSWWEKSIAEAETLLKIGDGRAYTNLLTTLKRVAKNTGFIELSRFVYALEKSLTEKARELPDEFLRSIMNMEDLSTFEKGETRTVKAKDPGHDDYEMEVTERINCLLDCSYLRDTASAELQRRKIRA